MFCAGGSLKSTSTRQINFSMTTVQQRIKENRKSLKMRFRQMIRDYTIMFKKSKDEATEKAFKQDLFILLAEAAGNVQDGGTLNSSIGLTMLVPGARKINNQLNLIIKKAGKFYRKNKYLSPMIQKKFYALLEELINVIAEKVGSGEVNEEELEKDDIEVEDDKGNTTTKKVAASASKRALIMYAAEDEMAKLMDSIDLEEHPVEDVTPDSIVFSGDELPEAFKSIKFTGMKRRCRCFNSEMSNFTFIMPLMEDSYKATLEDAFRKLKLRNILDTDTDVNNLDYSASELEDGNVKFTVSVNANKLNLTPEDEKYGVYPGSSMPENWISLCREDKSPYQSLIDMIDGGLTTSTLMKIESYLNGKSDAEKHEIRDVIVAKYGNNPIANLL